MDATGTGDQPGSGPRTRLRALRETAGLDQRQLADAADCSPGHLRMIETGLRRPGPRLARRIARALTERLGRPVDPTGLDDPADDDDGDTTRAA